MIEAGVRSTPNYLESRTHRLSSPPQFSRGQTEQTVHKEATAQQSMSEQLQRPGIVPGFGAYVEIDPGKKIAEEELSQGRAIQIPHALQ